MGEVYKITCWTSGKAYIGISGDGANARWKEHLGSARNGKKARSLLVKAIRKYGEHDFTIETIASSDDWETLCALERKFIREQGTKAPLGYNLTDGGEGALGLEWTLERRALISALRLGMKFSDSHRESLSVAHRGKKRGPMDIAVREKISIAAKLVGSDLQERLRRSERAKAQHASGKFGHRTWTSKSKESFSSKMKGRAIPAERAAALQAYWSKPENKAKRSLECRKKPEEMARRARVYWDSLSSEERKARAAVILAKRDNAKHAEAMRRWWAERKKNQKRSVPRYVPVEERVPAGYFF